MSLHSSLAVIMPVLDGAKFVGAAVDSILRQTWVDFELVVVDDGSTDATVEIVERHAAADTRLRVLKREHAGVAAAINEGLAATTADIVARMDADDIAAPERFATQLAYLRDHPDIAVVGTFVRIIDADGRDRKLRRFPVSPPDVAARMHRRNAMCHSSVMFRSAAVNAVGGYDANFRSAQDHDLWLRMSAAGFRLANFPTPLVSYRDHPGQITGAAKRPRTYLYSAMAILNDIFARNGLARIAPGDSASFDFAPLAAAIEGMLEDGVPESDRALLYYQTARLLRFYADRKGMERLQRVATRQALREGRLRFLARQLLYQVV